MAEGPSELNSVLTKFIKIAEESDAKRRGTEARLEQERREEERRHEERMMSMMFGFLERILNSTTPDNRPVYGPRFPSATQPTPNFDTFPDDSQNFDENTY